MLKPGMEQTEKNRNVEMEQLKRGNGTLRPESFFNFFLLKKDNFVWLNDRILKLIDGIFRLTKRLNDFFSLT